MKKTRVVLDLQKITKEPIQSKNTTKNHTLHSLPSAHFFPRFEVLTQTTYGCMSCLFAVVAPQVFPASSIRFSPHHVLSLLLRFCLRRRPRILLTEYLYLLVSCLSFPLFINDPNDLSILRILKKVLIYFLGPTYFASYYYVLGNVP